MVLYNTKLRDVVTCSCEGAFLHRPCQHHAVRVPHLLLEEVTFRSGYCV